MGSTKQRREYIEESSEIKCLRCKKRFSSKANLKKHKITHEQDKPWRCEICDKSFNQKRDYNNHMMQKHTSQRPNPCTVIHFTKENNNIEV